MLKKLFIGTVILLMCSVASAAERQGRLFTVLPSDWKECNTSLVITNVTNSKLIYNISWLDHDLERFKGQYITRAGGEIGPHKTAHPSKDFRLCPGRHKITWYLTGVSGEIGCIQYDFVITEDMIGVILSPVEPTFMPIFK